MEETKKQATSDPPRPNQFAGSIKGDACGDARHSSSGVFEKHDPVHDWYRPEIELALKNSAKRRADDKSNPNLAPAIPNDPEAVPDKRAPEELYLGLHLRNEKRPYMSKHARDFVRHMGNWDGFSNHGISAPEYCTLQILY